MPTNLELRARIADLADAISADHFTETQVAARADAFLAAAPHASLSEQTIFMLAETRAFTEAVLAAVLTDCKGGAADGQG